MFENVGGKIKGFAKFMFVLGCIGGGGTFLVGIVSWLGNSCNPSYLMLGLVGIPIFLANLFSSWFVYGFGELIESTEETNRLLCTGFSKDIAQEEEKRREEAAAQEKTKKELAEQQKQKEIARQTRIAAYWQEHTEEKKALIDKRTKAANALEAGGISTAQQQELLDLISAIDLELKKER